MDAMNDRSIQISQIPKLQHSSSSLIHASEQYFQKQILSLRCSTTSLNLPAQTTHKQRLNQSWWKIEVSTVDTIQVLILFGDVMCHQYFWHILFTLTMVILVCKCYFSRSIHPQCMNLPFLVSYTLVPHFLIHSSSNYQTFQVSTKNLPNLLVNLWHLECCSWYQSMRLIS